MFLLLFAEFRVDLYDFWEVSYSLNLASEDCFLRTGKDSLLSSSFDFDFFMKVSSLGLGGGLGIGFRGSSTGPLGLLFSF